MENQNTKIVVNDLKVVLGKKTILENINFDVKDGEFLSFLGPSGCGKTTILRVLIGLLKPTAGTVVKDGVDITALPASKAWQTSGI